MRQKQHKQLTKLKIKAMTTKDLQALTVFANEFAMDNSSVNHVLKLLEYYGSKAAYYFERRRTEYCDIATVTVRNGVCTIDYGHLVSMVYEEEGLLPEYEEYYQVSNIPIADIVEMIFAHYSEQEG